MSLYKVKSFPWYRPVEGKGSGRKTGRVQGA